MKTSRGLLIAALALAALAVAPAAALAGISADEYPATLEGEAGQLLVGTNGSADIVCSGLGFEAELEEASPTVTTSSVEDPTECGHKLNSFKTNGCQIELAPDGAGSFGIGPPGCGPITFTRAGCIGPFQIPAQTGLAAEYENFGSGDEAGFHVILSSTDVQFVGDGYCKPKELQGGGFLQTVAQVTAVNGADEAIGTSAITGGLTIGGDPEEAGRLEAVEYPVPIVGQRGVLPPPGVIELIDTGSVKFSCDVADYDGGVLSGPATSFGLDAEYSGCDVNGKALPVSVDMNSCRHEFSDFAYLEEDAYDGTSELACDEADAISIVTKTGGGGLLCTIEIPAQELSGGETVFGGNLAVDDEAGLAIRTEATGVAYTVTGGLCPLVGLKAGSYENGASEYDMWLEAEY